MAAAFIRPDAAHKSRLRLFVVQALVLSLFFTLFTRLWYMQVATGEDYQTAAAHQSVRDVVQQPARGLIVDDQGRPLVANRASWVVSIDRTLFGKLDSATRDRTLRRLSTVVHEPVAAIQARILSCGAPGSAKGTCWNGSPYQPVPVARDVRQKIAVKLLEQSEEFPGVLAQQDSVRAYPSPYGVNGAHVLGYLSPITQGELDTAKKDDDTSLNGASVVGRAGVEKAYDRYLRGTPGYTQVAVDSMGRVLGESGKVDPKPGDTLVTSIDADVQAYVEKQLHGAMMTARGTFDKVTGKNYVADSGAAVVMEAKTGRIVALASQPTYDPTVWSGGISSKELAKLYSKDSGDPLLSRATQGQYAPGSTWKPIMTVGALNNGFSQNTSLDCSSGLQVGNRWFKNYESASYGYISFARALELSCDTFFYRVGLSYWNKYGSDPTNVDAKDPLVDTAKDFGFGQTTGSDVTGEASGRIADRKWKYSYWKAMKGYYCKVDKQNTTGQRDFLHVFAHEFCLEGYNYRAGDAVNYVIGQGDTMVTPLQLARAYSALSNGGKLMEPQVAKAIVSPDGKLIKEIAPKVTRRIHSSKAALAYVDNALKGTPREGTLAWKFGGFPLDKVVLRGKTGSAEVYGKQSTSWVATYTKDYVVIMVITQGGTGSGTSGPAVRKIWEHLYGITGSEVKPAKAAIPGTVPPAGLPTFATDGSILPPSRKGSAR
ncbi:penicillin-binding protein 2 [Nocardioides korecus]